MPTVLRRSGCLDLRRTAEALPPDASVHSRASRGNFADQVRHLGLWQYSSGLKGDRAHCLGAVTDALIASGDDGALVEVAR